MAGTTATGAPDGESDTESELLGYAMLSLFAGLLIVGVGVLLEARVPAWIGAATAVVAILATVVVKVDHYRSVEMTPSQRTRIVGTWTMLALSASALVVVGVAVQFDYPYGRYFWALVPLVLVLTLLHRLFRGLYHPQVGNEE